jgi:hypothetical protein
MERDTHITAVVFRMLNNKVLALFPYSIYNGIGLIDSYMHVGQHSGAQYEHCIEISRPATEEEYKDLKKELESIGYNLRAIKRRNFNKYINAFNESRGF